MKASRVTMLATLILGGLALGGCNSKKPQQPAKDNHIVTGEKYSEIKEFFSDERIILNGDLTLSRGGLYKLDWGVIEYEEIDDHRIYVLDRSRYNAETGAIDADMYGKSDETWVKSRLKGYSLGIFYSIFQLFYFDYYMPESFESLTYSEETHKYTYRDIEQEIDVVMGFENDKLVYYSVWGEILGEPKPIVYTISDYDTTTVEVPTEYIE